MVLIQCRGTIKRPYLRAIRDRSTGAAERDRDRSMRMRLGEPD
jgi:hypothetical protein